MKLKAETADMRAYLECTGIVDFNDAGIAALAQSFSACYLEEEAYARAAYTFVRDNISHSADMAAPQVVTLTASQVLRHGEGICFAKSHLLAALLRFRGTPCGFCYQILMQSAANPVLRLHGLNAVFINNCWHRLDARGNKPGVNARFDLENERLAYKPNSAKGENDIAVIFAVPAGTVVSALSFNKTFGELWANLPADIKPLAIP